MISNLSSPLQSEQDRLWFGEAERNPLRKQPEREKKGNRKKDPLFEFEDPTKKEWEEKQKSGKKRKLADKTKKFEMKEQNFRVTRSRDKKISTKFSLPVDS